MELSRSRARRESPPDQGVGPAAAWHLSILRLSRETMSGGPRRQEGGGSMSTPHIHVTPDPPLPSRSCPIEDKSLAQKAKATLTTLAIAAVLLPLAWWLWRHGFVFYAIVAGAVGAFAVVGSFGSTLRSSCPFCRAEVDDILDRSEGRLVRCEAC